MFQKNELVRSDLDACTYRVLIPGEDKDYLKRKLGNGNRSTGNDE